MYALVAGYGYLGDDDRADAWFSHGWLDTPLDLLEWLDQPRNGVGVNSACAHRHPGRARGRRHRLPGGHAARRAARRDPARASSPKRARASPATSSSAPAPPSCWRRAKRRCAPPSKAPRAWRSTPTARPSSSWRAKSSAATRPAAQCLAQGARSRHRAAARTHQGSRCASRKNRRRASCASTASPPARSPGQIENLVNVQALLQRETRNLSTALRRPEVRGRWGEITLRRVVELAGLSEHCDFTEQAHVDSAERGPLRPDLLVRMPESRTIVVDAKTPLDAYLDAVEAQDDETRRIALATPRHAGGAARARARPEELLGAVRAQPGIRGAVPAGRSVPVGGAGRASRPDRVGAQATHHRDHAVHAHGAAQGDRLWLAAEPASPRTRARSASSARTCTSASATFVSHLQKVSRSLGNAVDSFNASVGSMERNVLPQARKFTELGVAGDDAALGRSHRAAGAPARESRANPIRREHGRDPELSTERFRSARASSRRPMNSQAASSW